MEEYHRLLPPFGWLYWVRFLYAYRIRSFSFVTDVIRDLFYLIPVAYVIRGREGKRLG